MHTNPVFYQIFIQSFADSNNDGWGDIQGIISKLPYIATLGVDGIWVTPIYVSPLHDNGYDVEDYYNINPRYGTMSDAEKLIEEAHKLGLKIIFDLVVNHTSWDHEWFKKSCQRIEPYTDFYIWKKTPNDWHSKFGGSAWEYNEQRQEYYLHLFSKQQVDLNWENSLVREEVKKIIRFWAEKKVDGFRLDVINLISKEQQFLDDPDTLGQQYYTDGPRVLEYFKEIGSIFDELGLITIGELSSSDISHSIEYTNPKNKMLTSVFSFKHLSADWADIPEEKKISSQLAKLSNTPFNLIKMKKIIKEWQTKMLDGGGVLSPCWGNHDQPRIVSRFGNDSTEYRELSAKMLCIGQLFLSGIPFIYQGEELGMTNFPYQSLKDFKDVETLSAITILKESNYSDEAIFKIISKITRENAHSPMQWDTTPHAGFSKEIPWSTINPDYKTINAEKQINHTESVYTFYKTALAIRKQFQGLIHSEYQTILDDHPSVWGYIRVIDTQQLLILCNFSDSVHSIQHELIKLGTPILINYSDIHNIQEDIIKLRPYEGIVLHIQ